MQGLTLENLKNYTFRRHENVYTLMPKCKKYTKSKIATLYAIK